VPHPVVTHPARVRYPRPKNKRAACNQDAERAARRFDPIGSKHRMPLAVDQKAVDYWTGAALSLSLAACSARLVLQPSDSSLVWLSRQARFCLCPSRCWRKTSATPSRRRPSACGGGSGSGAGAASSRGECGSRQHKCERDRCFQIHEFPFCMRDLLDEVRQMSNRPERARRAPSVARSINANGCTYSWAVRITIARNTWTT